jgi:hypothetical protein
VSTYLERMVDRRRFFRYAGAALAAAGTGEFLAGPGTAESASTVIAYFLDPEWGAGDPDCPTDEAAKTGACHACNSCHSHAVNKLFTSAALADATRAHLHCKCLVGSMELDRLSALAVFGPPAGPMHRDAFDRRGDEAFVQPGGPAGRGVRP